MSIAATVGYGRRVSAVIDVDRCQLSPSELRNDLRIRYAPAAVAVLFGPAPVVYPSSDWPTLASLRLSYATAFALRAKRPADLVQLTAV